VNQARSEQQDLELARRAGEGDERAWREIYDRGCQPLFNFLCYQVGDRDAAMDILQDTFITAMKRIDRYRGDGPLQGWLRGIALRKSLDWRRSLARKIRLGEALRREAEPAQAPAADPRLGSEDAELQRALAKLSPRQRAALLLRELEELSFREVAEALGCREATARVHHHRAREAMRGMLGAAALSDELEGVQP